MDILLNKKEVNLDSSLFSDLDKSLTKEEYIDHVIKLLQPILDSHFSNCPPKTKIRIKRDAINFSCPYCDDSMQDKYKKRGSIILEGKFKNHFKCHNGGCGMFKRVDNFFKDFKAVLELDFINYISSDINNRTYSNNKYDASLLLDIKEIEKYAIGRQELKEYFNLIEVKGSPVWPWLVNRCQYDESKFLYSPSKNYLAILNLTPNGKILGLQKRLLIKTRNKYNTYKLSKLYDAMGKKEILPDWMDIMSQLFNICLVNFDRPVMMTEGPLDAYVNNNERNIIANTGANKQFPLDMNIYYLFDADETGKKRSLEEINKGNNVFLWEKLKRDYELPFRNKWDINDLIIWCNKNKKSIPKYINYFSVDMYDALDI